LLKKRNRKRLKTPPQKPLVDFENRVRAFVRKTPEYAALLDLGMVDISEKFWEGELLHYKEESSLVFETCIYKASFARKDDDPILYHIYGKSISTSNDILKKPPQYRYPLGYTMLFYKIANGIIYGLKKLYKIYFDRLLEEGNNETEFVVSMKRHELPLHINYIWMRKVNKKIYMNRLKTRNQTLAVEIA